MSKFDSLKKSLKLLHESELPKNIQVDPANLRLSDIGKEAEYNYRLDPLQDIYYGVKDDKVIGHIGLDDSDSIKSLYVNPEFRGQGNATEMYKELSKQVPEFKSDELMAMEPEAKSIWEKLKKDNPDKVSKTDTSYIAKGPLKFESEKGIGSKVLDAVSLPQRLALQKLAQSLGEKGNEEVSEESSQQIIENLASRAGIPEDSTAGNIAKALGVAGLEVFADPTNLIPGAAIGKVAKAVPKIEALKALKKIAEAKQLKKVEKPFELIPTSTPEYGNVIKEIIPELEENLGKVKLLDKPKKLGNVILKK